MDVAAGGDDIERAHLRDPSDQSFTIFRYPPPQSLAPWIRRYWIPVWEVPDGEVTEQKVLQYPVCLAITTPAYSRFVGPARGLSVTTLQGRSWGFGVMFAPATGAGLLGRAVSTLTDTWCELEGISAMAGLTPAIAELMVQGPDDPEVHRAARQLLEQRLAFLGEPDQESQLVNTVVSLVEDDPALMAVGQLCERVGLSERALQRLTARRLGLSPAWLIRRRRLHEAADRLRGEGRLAEVAAELGYADQAHFSRDFRTSTGLTPGQFMATSRGSSR